MKHIHVHHMDYRVNMVELKFGLLYRVWLQLREGMIHIFLCICLVKERKGKRNRENLYFRYFVCKEKGKKIILCFSLIKKKMHIDCFFLFFYAFFIFSCQPNKEKLIFFLPIPSLLFHPSQSIKLVLSFKQTQKSSSKHI